MIGRKQPVYLMVALASCLVMAAYNYFENRAVFLDELGTTDVLHREKEILVNLRLAQLLGQRHDLDELKDRLEQARLNHDIDYFIGFYKGEPLFWGTADGRYESLISDYKPGVDYITDDLSFRAEMVAPDVMVMAGINKRTDVALAIYMDHYRRVFIEQALALGFLAFAVFAFYSRDLLQMIRVFRSHDRTAFAKIKTKSRESEIFAQGLLGYEASMDALRESHSRLDRQVLPSLKKEILSGKTPPYDFLCTMVRTDINNFSTIYNTHDVSKFMQTINGFFEEVSHVVARHRGLVHEFVGDEVIFYFKDEECGNSFMTALAAVFEINQIASRISNRTMHEDIYPFTIKSSLAHGRVRFGPLVNGHSIAGAILIETVRILSQVVEKDGNVVFFDSRHSELLRGVFELEEAMQVQLKGFQGVRTLLTCHRRQPLNDILKELNLNTVENLHYYRSDEEIAEVISFLQTQMGTEGPALLLAVFKALRQMPVGITSFHAAGAEHVARGVYAMLTHIDQIFRPSHEKQGAILLSNTLMLMQNLLIPQTFDERFQRHLRGYLRDSDQRVVASALEALTYFQSTVDKNVYRELFHHADNRVVANALVQEGMQDLSPLVIKRLKRMLLSKGASNIASGLYALGELALYHRSRDIVYFSTQVEFKALLQSLPKFVNHDEKKVRKQAMQAARKAADAGVISTLYQKIESHGDPSVLVEAHQVFGTSFGPAVADSKKSA